MTQQNAFGSVGIKTSVTVRQTKKNKFDFENYKRQREINYNNMTKDQKSFQRKTEPDFI